MEDLSDFQRGQIFGARLAGSSVTKMVTLLGVSIAAVFNVMTAYTNRGKTSPTARTCGRCEQRILAWRRDSHRTAFRDISYLEFLSYLSTHSSSGYNRTKITHSYLKTCAYCMWLVFIMRTDCRSEGGQLCTLFTLEFFTFSLYSLSWM